MQPDEKHALSEYRLSRAEETLDDAKANLEQERYESAANRAYYAAFQALRAVLSLDGIDRKSHSGVIAEFRRLYVKTGFFQSSISKTIDDLSHARNLSDYNDFYRTERDTAVKLVQGAETVVNTVKTYLQIRNQ